MRARAKSKQRQTEAAAEALQRRGQRRQMGGGGASVWLLAALSGGPAARSDLDEGHERDLAEDGAVCDGRLDTLAHVEGALAHPDQYVRGTRQLPKARRDGRQCVSSVGSIGSKQALAKSVSRSGGTDAVGRRRSRGHHTGPAARVYLV